MVSVLRTALCICAAAGSLLADISYQQKTEITGGAMASMMKFASVFSKQAREPIASQVYVKGHRIARIGAHTGEIIDVDKETITHIDFDRKTYAVQTFAEMKQQIEEAMARAKGEKPDPNAPKVDAKISAKVTGQTKVIDGLDAKQAIITVSLQSADEKSGQKGSMDVVTDNWMAPVPGYQEVREVNRIMGEKMGTVLSGSGFGSMLRPSMSQGMGDAMRELAKMDGAPIEQIVRMTGTATAPTEGEPATHAGNQDSAADNPLAKLRGLGGFHKKKADADANGETGSNSSSGSLIEMTTHASGFSTAPVDSSKFEPPTDFKQVEASSMERGHRR
jgi:hypothetical protein